MKLAPVQRLIYNVLAVMVTDDVFVNMLTLAIYIGH